MGHGGKKRGSAAMKKRSRANARQKLIRAGGYGMNVALEASNSQMTCDTCGEIQKNRAFCYFCAAVQRVPQCGECHRTKCIGTDCVVPHPGRHVTGMALVGAVCDFCEAWVCHSKRCLERCPLQGAHCVECDRGVWEHGGRLFTCASCAAWICEDDQAEHQATCQVMDAETDHCISCNRIGCWSCLKCKICFCDKHVKSKLQPDRKKDEDWRCKRCGYGLQETKLLSVSTKKHDYGRQTRDAASTGYYGRMEAVEVGIGHMLLHEEGDSNGSGDSNGYDSAEEEDPDEDGSTSENSSEAGQDGQHPAHNAASGSCNSIGTGSSEVAGTTEKDAHVLERGGKR